MAVKQPPNPASLSTASAGKYGVQINRLDLGGTRQAPVWQFINGIMSFEPLPQPKLEDDSDIYMDAWQSQNVVGNALNITISGIYKGTDDPSFVPDPGLEFLLSKAFETASDNEVHIKWWRYDELDESFEHFFATDCKKTGGKPSENQKWSGTLTGRGKPTKVAKPTDVAVNEVQRLAFIGSPTALTFKLAALGSETAALDYTTITAATLQTALTGLAHIGTGNAVVTGDKTAGFAIAYQGARAGVNMPVLVPTGITGATPTNARPVVSTLVEGQAAA